MNKFDIFAHKRKGELKLTVESMSLLGSTVLEYPPEMFNLTASNQELGKLVVRLAKLWR